MLSELSITFSSGMIMTNKPDNNFDYEGEILVKKKEKLKKPRMYAVILHNDDYTTQEFVVEVLIKFFHKNYQEAYDLMMKIHLEGKATAALCSKDVAETKVAIVTSYSRKNGMPLLATYETQT